MLVSLPLLFLIVVVATCEGASAPAGVRSLIVLHERVTDPAALRQALRHAYEKHIVGSVAAGSPHLVSLWVDTSCILTWTDANSEGGARDVLYAIEHVELQALPTAAANGGACAERYSFAAVLDAIRTSPEGGARPTNIYFVVDNARDSSSYAEATQAAQRLTGAGVQIYALGVGKCALTAELRRISGPCHPIFGCHPPFAFFQSTSYAGLQRARTEVRAQRQAQKHAVTTEEGLTPAQLAITIVLCVLMGVLVLWCLMYSLCYMPRYTRVQDVYTVAVKRRIPFRVRERLF